MNPTGSAVAATMLGRAVLNGIHACTLQHLSSHSTCRSGRRSCCHAGKLLGRRIVQERTIRQCCSCNRATKRLQKHSRQSRCNGWPTVWLVSDRRLS